MNTKIRLAGADGWYPETGVMWAGNLPLVSASLEFMVDQKLYRISQVSIEIVGMDSFQVVWVVPR